MRSDAELSSDLGLEQGTRPGFSQDDYQSQLRHHSETDSVGSFQRSQISGGQLNLRAQSNVELEQAGDGKPLAAQRDHILDAISNETRRDIHLTGREAECLWWAAEGKTADVTAAILGVSRRAVRFHLDSARMKLGADNITHAVTKAFRRNLLPGRSSVDESAERGNFLMLSGR